MLHGREAKGKDLVLRINDEEIADPNLVGNEFNNYISSVASSLASTIPPVDFDPLTHVQRLENTFVWCDVTAEEGHKTILSFKSKMSSINDIPNFEGNCQDSRHEAHGGKYLLTVRFEFFSWIHFQQFLRQI